MNQSSDVTDMHWMMDALQSIEVGLLVIDSDYHIIAWNGFMEHHSGVRADKVIGKHVMEVATDVPAEWLKRQLDTVSTLKIPIYSTWKQRPFLFHFNSYRPITGKAAHMYQNITFQPLSTVDGSAPNICISLYDVSKTAVSEMEMSRLNDELAHLSRTDRMTGLNNRGHWEEEARREFLRCQRYGHTSTLVIFDIDHFKSVNDTYGHQVGDEVIKALANKVKDQARESDLAGRYGGEEFVLILSETLADGAKCFCERLRQTVEAMVVEAHGESVSFTISIGLSEFNEEVESLDQWLQQADGALYYAKEHGRNQVIQYDPDEIIL